MKNRGIEQKINEYLEAYTKLWAFSGSIAAMKDGEVLFKNAYGYANREHKILNTTETKYRIWSITKQFTAVAILILEERGALKVEDSLRKHFPEWTKLDSDITIHHLLTHTSGIFNYSNLPDSHRTFQRMHHDRAELIEMFTSKALDFEPGTDWNYCNTGYYLLGLLIEKLSGKTYSEFLQDNIFKPLGMFNTGVDDDKTIVSNKASGYYLNGNDLIHCNYINMELMYSSGGMYSTVEDLLIWDGALRTNKLLNRKSIKKMNTAYKNNYGYGVSINMNCNRRVVHHNGSCEGFLTEIRRYVDDDFCVVVLSNYGFTAVNKLCKDIATIAFEDKYEMPAKPEVYDLSTETLNGYLGIYGGEGFKLELKKEEDDLNLIIDDEYVLPTYPIGENILHHTWIDEEYVFEKDGQGTLSLWGAAKRGDNK